MREVRDRAGRRGPHRPEAIAEAPPSRENSCARVARRSRLRPLRAGRERPVLLPSLHKQLRRERALPCERHRLPVPQRVRPPLPPVSSRHALPVPQRSAGESHRRCRGRPEQKREHERLRHVVDRLSEPPTRTGPGLARHSRPPTLRPGGDHPRSATGTTARLQSRAPARARLGRRRLTRARRVPREGGARTPRACRGIRSLLRRNRHGDWGTQPAPCRAAWRRQRRCGR